MNSRDTIPKVKFPCPVRRVRIQVRKDDWQIVKEIEIPSMTLSQPAEPPDGSKGRGLSGFWVEAVDRKERALYRPVMANPFENSSEIFESDGSMHREERVRDEFVFDVLIPDLPDITELLFYSDVTANGKRSLRSDMVKRLPLKRAARRGGRNGRR